MPTTVTPTLIIGICIPVTLFCVFVLFLISCPRIVAISRASTLPPSTAKFHLLVFLSIFFHKDLPHVVRNGTHLLFYSFIVGFDLVPILRSFVYAVFAIYSVMCYFATKGSGFSGGTCGLMMDALFHILTTKSLVACDFCHSFLATAFVMSFVLSTSIKQELIAVSVLILGRPDHSPFFSQSTRLDPGVFGHAAGRLMGFLCVIGDLGFKHYSYAGPRSVGRISSRCLSCSTWESSLLVPPVSSDPKLTK